MTREDSMASVRGPPSPEDHEIVKLAGDLAGLGTSDTESRGPDDPLGSRAAGGGKGCGAAAASGRVIELEHEGRGSGSEGEGPLEGHVGPQSSVGDVKDSEAVIGCTLFVGDLARAMTEEELQLAFTAAGKVVAVDIKRDRNTGRNLGYGFVQMASQEEAQKAKAQLHDAEVLGRKIRVGGAQRNTTLFVGDLDETVTVVSLKDAFARFGPIVDEQTTVRYSKSGRHGFVKFVNRLDAETARRMMNGARLNNTTAPIRVVWHHSTASSSLQAMAAASGSPSLGMSQQAAGFERFPSQQPRPCSVHVQFDVDSHAGPVLETTLHSIFAPYGEVVGVSMPTGGALFECEGGRRRGYGFVHFSGTTLGRQCAAEAIRSMNQQMCHGIRLQCSLSKKGHSGIAAPHSGRVAAAHPSVAARGVVTGPMWTPPYPHSDMTTPGSSVAAGQGAYPPYGDPTHRMWAQQIPYQMPPQFPGPYGSYPPHYTFYPPYGYSGYGASHFYPYPHYPPPPTGGVILQHHQQQQQQAPMSYAAAGGGGGGEAAALGQQPLYSQGGGKPPGEDSGPPSFYVPQQQHQQSTQRFSMGRSPEGFTSS